METIKVEPPPGFNDRTRSIYMLKMFGVVTKTFDKQGQEKKLFKDGGK